MNRFVLALDQGTTSSRAIVFRRDGAIVSVAQQEFPQIEVQPWEELEALRKKSQEPCAKHGDGPCDCGKVSGSASKIEPEVTADRAQPRKTEEKSATIPSAAQGHARPPAGQPGEGGRKKKKKKR